MREAPTRLRRGVDAVVRFVRSLRAGDRTAAAAATPAPVRSVPDAVRTAAGPASGPVRSAPATKLTDLTGPGFSSDYGIGGTDLGIPVTTPDGRLLLIFGDTFDEPTAQGRPEGWRTPTALYADPATLAGGLRWIGPARGDRDGGPRRAGALVGQPHGARIHDLEISTQLPSDVVLLGDTLYLQVMGCVGFPHVGFTELYASTDDGATWSPTGCWWPGDQWNGWFQCLTLCPGDDGYLYCVSTGFQRDAGLMLSRVRIDALLDPQAWEPWGWDAGTGWSWGGSPALILGGRFGESSLRRVEGRWVLCVFDNGNARIDVRVLPSLTVDMSTVPVTTVITAAGWAGEDHSRGLVAQPYGGYILPGSTLADLHLVVSQWNTTVPANWPYKAMHFRTTLPS